MRSALALARFSRGLTQQQLAERAGLAKTTIQRIEGGDLPRVRTALKIAEALDEDAGELFLAHRPQEPVTA